MFNDHDSVSAASYIPLSRVQTAPGGFRHPQVYMRPEDMYRITRGLTEDWGVEGYTVNPKSATYKRLEFKVPKDERKTFLDVLKKRAGEPDPTKYQKDLTKHRKPPEHKPIFKAPRNTYIDVIIKNGPKTPGPGAHFKTAKGTTSEKTLKVRGPSFGKEEGLSYLSTCQVHGLETPGAGHYFQLPKASGNVVKATLKPSYFFVLPKPGKKLEKDRIGPGTYHAIDYVRDPKKDKLYHDPVRAQSARPAMNRAKRVTTAEEVPKVTKGVPPVGVYKNSTKTTESFKSLSKDIHFYVAKEKQLHRFPEMQVAQHKFVPGPGAYKEEDDETRLRAKR